VRIGFDEELLERYEVCCVPLEPSMSSKLVRIDVHLADNVAASAFLHNALLEEFNPFLLSGRRVLNERPEGVIIVQGNERDAEDIS